MVASEHGGGIVAIVGGVDDVAMGWVIVYNFKYIILFNKFYLIIYPLNLNGLINIKWFKLRI